MAARTASIDRNEEVCHPMCTRVAAFVLGRHDLLRSGDSPRDVAQQQQQQKDKQRCEGRREEK